MLWAGDQSEELWGGIYKVEDLGDEEEEHGLAEVAEDGDHRKCHASKVAVCVTNKHSGGIPVGGGMYQYECVCAWVCTYMYVGSRAHKNGRLE